MDELVSKRGAYTYVRKPVDVDKLLELISGIK